MGNKDKDNELTEGGVLDLIEKYLSEERDVKSYDEQIAVVVYYLLGGTQFDDFIGYYPTASASVLRAFASSDVADKLKQEVGTFNFDTLCKMLERMVEFCWDIKGNQMFLAQLDQLMFGTSVRAWPDCYILHYKNKYERLLKNGSED
ncbi:hypothetical protein A3860_14785 [Niastella vici]|uniref:Uncharacterized protein n=1 Tax=Niastella vici TaxID=1703345 RepID=A0A1V9G5K0_9BACT|nr:hypothetical protein [Niastella vici]OQP65857.1 hypothetical protein A3860_14785 [Niastella vici]